MWYFADFNILIRKIILNKFQFQRQSVLNLFLLQFKETKNHPYI